MFNVFCVRAEFGQYTSAFKRGGYAAIGWLPDNNLKDLMADGGEEIKKLYSNQHPDDSNMAYRVNFIRYNSCKLFALLLE